jgi:hypothetical protein
MLRAAIQDHTANGIFRRPSIMLAHNRENKFPATGAIDKIAISTALACRTLRAMTAIKGAVSPDITAPSIPDTVSFRYASRALGGTLLAKNTIISNLKPAGKRQQANLTRLIEYPANTPNGS